MLPPVLKHGFSFYSICFFFQHAVQYTAHYFKAFTTDNSSFLSLAITQHTVIKSDFVWLHNTEQSVLSICRYLLRMSLSCGWNLFFAQSCSTAIRLYNKRSDTRTTSDTTHYAHSHQIFNVLSHCPVVCSYHFCTCSTQHMWTCFLSMLRTSLPYKSRPFSVLSPIQSISIH